MGRQYLRTVLLWLLPAKLLQYQLTSLKAANIKYQEVASDKQCYIHKYTFPLYLHWGYMFSPFPWRRISIWEKVANLIWQACVWKFANIWGKRFAWAISSFHVRRDEGSRARTGLASSWTLTRLWVCDQEYFQHLPQYWIFWTGSIL